MREDELWRRQQQLWDREAASWDAERERWAAREATLVEENAELRRQLLQVFPNRFPQYLLTAAPVVSEHPANKAVDHSICLGDT